MSGDKRSVTTDALQTLGTILDETARRDAIHLAVEPVVAGCDLTPGQPIALNTLAENRGKAWPANPGTDFPPLGIVDPFMEYGPSKGERFWMVLLPRTITSLRHVWEHPAFPPSDHPDPVKAASEEWLRGCAKRLEVEYQELINSVCPEQGWASFGFEPMGDREIPDEFWHHYEVVTGNKVFPGKRSIYFSCSC